jgi:HEAT repeat protein
VNLDVNVAATVALVLGAMAATWLLTYLGLKGRHYLAGRRARALAERLRRPAASLEQMEEQSAALEELSEFRDVEAAVQAARGLLGEMDATVRTSALEVLRRTRALDRWVRDLHRTRYAPRIRAIQALGEVGDERALDELLEALGDDDPDVVRAASRAVLVRDRDYASERLAEALSSPNRRIAETAAAVLVGMGEEALEPLVSRLSSLDAQARRLAVEGLGSIGEVAAVHALLPLLETDPEADVRVAALEAGARLGGEAILFALRRASQADPDWFVRARAYVLLAECNAPGATDYLLDALAGMEPPLPSASEHEEAVEIVLEGDARIRNAIITGLRVLGLSDEEIQQACPAAPPAVEELTGPESGLREEPGFPDWAVLLSSLRSREAATRAEVVREIIVFGRQALPHLHRALCDPEPVVRAEAARGLGRVGCADCMPVLSACLRDPDSDVRLAVAAAVRAIVTRDAVRAPEIE